MKKLIVCQTATILCGLLAIAIYFSTDELPGNGPNHKLIGEVFGLLGAIAATQWEEYQKRLSKKSLLEPRPDLTTRSAS